jgi:hypothetical protein
MTVRDWITEKLRRLIFLLDALFEAVQTLGVVAIILGARRLVVWLAEMSQASEETRDFVGIFVTVAEIILVVACFGVNLPFVFRDIRIAWKRAMQDDSGARQDKAKGEVRSQVQAPEKPARQKHGGSR